jgi:asparagine synthase (glutamine-hydrolysing)
MGPTVCQLSGGFDSAGVAATAARLNFPAQVFSITAVPQAGIPVCPTGSRGFANEWKHASAVAAMHPNLKAYAAPAADPTYTDPRILFHHRGMPVRNFMNLSWFGTANRMARDLGARVVLVGAAGNITLSWSGMNGLADLAHFGQLRSLGREVMGLSRRGGQRRWQTVRNNVLPALIPSKLRSVFSRKASMAAWQRTSAISAEFALSADAEGIAIENGGLLPGLGHGDSARLRFLEQMWRRPGSALLRPFYGVERRDPLADIRLVDFCISLPPEQYLLDGVTRRLARRTLADRLPAFVLEENRIGRQNPEWFFRLSQARGQMRATLERLQRSPLASYALDLPRMRSILDNWPVDASDAQARSGDLIRVLARGTNIGEFLEWTEGGCVAPSEAVTHPDVGKGVMHSV